MSEVIGKGVIEVSADATKLKAGVDDAKRSIKSLGKDIGDSVSAGSARASRSIDNYVKKLQTAAATNGMSTRESELYTLSLKGASKAQLEAADSALKMSEGYQRGLDVSSRMRAGFIALAAAASAAAAATYAGTIALIAQVGNYQDLAEKIGDTAVNVSSLKTASDVSGTSIDTIATASVKLTAALSKTDDESKLVGGAIKALGLNFEQFKKQSPVEQLQTVARAFGEFADGSEKTATAVALFGKSGAELLGFLKEYSEEGLKAAYITDEQAKAADDFADAQARLKSEIEQFLQVTAVNAISILTEIGDLFRSIGESQRDAGSATSIIQGAINGLLVVFQSLVVIGSDVVFVFKGVGTEIGVIAAQLAALLRLDFAGFSAISDAVKRDAAQARSELDKFQARVMNLGEKNAEEPGWLNSITSAAGVNYYNESQNVFKQTEEAVGNAFKGMEDALVEFVKTGKLDFKSLVDSIISDIARIVIKQQITGPLAGLLGGLFGGGGGVSRDTEGFERLIGSVMGGRAIGGPVSAGGLYQINEKGSPEVLNAGGKSYLMMGNQSGAVSPGGGGQPVQVIQNFTVGDVASMAQVKQAVAGSERRLVAGLGRSRAYGGAAA